MVFTFCFRPEKPFLYKYGQKDHNCQLKQKFGTKRLTCMPYSSCFLHAIVARMRLPFFKIFLNFVHFCPNFQIFCPFFALFSYCFWKIARMPLLSKLRPDLNMRNSMIMLTFSVFDHKYPSWASLVQKLKIVCSKWNLIQRLIRIWRIHQWCLFYLF